MRKIAKKEPKQVNIKQDLSLLRRLLGWMVTILVIFGIVFGVRLVLGMFMSNDVVSGDSMMPTLMDGDRLVSMKNRDIKRNDIVVMDSPTEKGRQYIKRVIGLPGDTVAVQNERLLINGREVKQPYIKSEFARGALKSYQQQDGTTAGSMRFTDDFTLKSLKATHESRVPKGSYFVMGDNRRISYDSRYFGFVKKQSIESVVVWRYWPLNTIGSID